jgi:hypothetical protein
VTDATTTNVGVTQMNEVSMGDASNGVAVGQSGQIVFTTNGGVDWTDATTNKGGSTVMYGVSMSDASNGVAVGTSGTIVYTSDGGDTWTDATTTNVGTTIMNSVSMSDASNGVAVGNSGTIVFTASVSSEVPSASTTSSGGGGGGKNNCDSNGFGNNNSLRVYQVTYNIKTYEVQVQAYSTCGSVSAKITTPMQQSVLGLSTEQTLLDDRIAIYSGFLDESEEKFNISVQNKRHSFSETFYINDKSIIKKYTGDTGYTSEQQGTALPTITSEQITVVSEPSVTQVVQTIEESIPIEEQILDEPLEAPKLQSIGYTPEPVAEEIKPQCGVGTKLVDGICKIIKTDEPKFCFLFWCW